MDFRKAGEQDISSLIELEKTADGVKTYSAMLTVEEWESELLNSAVYLIEVDGRASGLISYEKKSVDHAYISGLVIHPDSQGKGLARQALIKLLVELSWAKRIDLVTHPENVKAVSLYKSLGFVMESRIEDYFGDGEPRILLVLNRLV